MKIRYLTLAIFISLPTDFAQAQGFIPVTTQINTPYGNVPHTYYVPSAMHYYYGRGNISLKYDFNVVFTNGRKRSSGRE